MFGRKIDVPRAVVYQRKEVGGMPGWLFVLLALAVLASLSKGC